MASFVDVNNEAFREEKDFEHLPIYKINGTIVCFLASHFPIPSVVFISDIS